MHGHWTKIASFGIKVKSIADLMTAMTSFMAFLTD